MSASLLSSHSLLLTAAMVYQLVFNSAIATINKPDETPELDEIAVIVNTSPPPSGVLFVIMDHDEEALRWILPRMVYYIRILQAKHKNLSLAVVSHGDEILALTTTNQSSYSKLHKTIEQLVIDDKLEFHVCGAFAAANGLTEDDFPDYIDVVPFGPSQIADYRAVDYKVISLELTW